MNNYSKITLTMVRDFDVAPEEIFEAWINPDMMKKCFFTLEGTNKITKNTPEVGGSWEIVDHRNGKDYRAIGEYIEMNRPEKLAFTFKMPQFSELEDTITVEIMEKQQGSEMIFSQNIIVPHEENWTKSDVEKALKDYHDGSEHGWNLMFMGLKELVETGEISYKG
ncbi:SRPBCC domain-containing protein [Bacillus nitratireducens]|uniref:SRPBCC family protein n=1 Tax=Bacillus nitratireducens TaxID=2026193 RepID=UPI002E1BA543|nr:SRPBCC domain-containing protein [Bacillus nitratireducens]